MSRTDNGLDPEEMLSGSDFTILTASDIAMLEWATRRGVQYLDFDPTAYDEDE